MRGRLILFLGLAVVLAPAAATAQQPTEAELAAGMQRWQEAATPGEKHRFLNQFVGRWETTTRIWMDPASPMESTGSAEFSWVLGGRFLQQDYSGSMMGTPFKGVGHTGYDNLRAMYVGTWMDEMATGISTMEGRLDQTGKVLTMYGTVDDPILDLQDKMAKYVLRTIDADTFVFEIHDLDIVPGEQKVVEITYRRTR